MREYFGGLQEEMRRRYRELERRKKRKISDYNRRPPKGERRMPYLVVIIDEFASCVHELGQDEAERAVRKVAEQGRAVGIHLIVFTQYPKSDVISSVTTSNMPGRVSFYMPKSEQSRVILETDAAHTQLGNDQLGRAIMLHNGKEHLVQTPLVTDRQISHFIAAARSGTAVQDIGLPIDPEEILRWSLTVNFNRLGFREIKTSFADREISDADMLSLLHSMDDPEYDIDGTLYVVRNIGGSAGRRVELLDQAENLAPKGDDAPKPQNTQHKTQNHAAFRADLRRVLDTYQAEIRAEKFRGNGINMDIDSDLFTLEPAENGREWALLNDVKIICQAHNVGADEILKIMESEK
jgi:DNA segregation ATPase FtsK/SpoIIIE-like protein